MYVCIYIYRERERNLYRERERHTDVYCLKLVVKLALN